MATAHYVSLVADTKRASARGTRWILHRAIATSVFDTKLNACGEPFGDLTTVIAEAETRLAAEGVTVTGWTTFPKTGNLRAELAEQEGALIGPCSWLIDLGLRPEPDSPSDRIIVECGAPTRVRGAGWRCDNGHAHAGIEAELAPGGPEWQREQRDRAEAGW